MIDMENILITNIIEETKIDINFDFKDGTISFPSIELSISGDVELNPLVIKLTELLEFNRQIDIEISDVNTLVDSDAKIKLIVDALIEIYNSFNLNILQEESEEGDNDEF